jgi:hypothetical protein
MVIVWHISYAINQSLMPIMATLELARDEAPQR